MTMRNLCDDEYPKLETWQWITIVIVWMIAALVVGYYIGYFDGESAVTSGASYLAGYNAGRMSCCYAANSTVGFLEEGYDTRDLLSELGYIRENTTIYGENNVTTSV